MNIMNINTLSFLYNYEYDELHRLNKQQGLINEDLFNHCDFFAR